VGELEALKQETTTLRQQLAKLRSQYGISDAISGAIGCEKISDPIRCESDPISCEKKVIFIIGAIGCEKISDPIRCESDPISCEKVSAPQKPPAGLSNLLSPKPEAAQANSDSGSCSEAAEEFAEPGSETVAFLGDRSDPPKPWTREEDKRLWDLQKKFGNQWLKFINEGYFPGRSAFQITGRFHKREMKKFKNFEDFAAARQYNTAAARRYETPSETPSETPYETPYESAENCVKKNCVKKNRRKEKQERKEEETQERKEEETQQRKEEETQQRKEEEKQLLPKLRAEEENVAARRTHSRLKECLTDRTQTTVTHARPEVFETEKPAELAPIKEVDGPEFRVGETVLYYSENHKKWVNARVLEKKEDRRRGMYVYRLSCKQNSWISQRLSKEGESRILRAGEELAAVAFTTRQKPAAEVFTTELNPQPVEPEGPEFQVGETVQYHSERNGWVEATVLDKRQDDRRGVVYKLSRKGNTWIPRVNKGGEARIRHK
jgi:hypothetical protein